MTAKEFIFLVKSMRDAQKRYFAEGRYSESGVLAEAKRIERAVDVEIKCVLATDQRSLFPPEKGE